MCVSSVIADGDENGDGESGGGGFGRRGGGFGGRRGFGESSSLYAREGGVLCVSLTQAPVMVMRRVREGGGEEGVGLGGEEEEGLVEAEDLVSNTPHVWCIAPL